LMTDFQTKQEGMMVPYLPFSITSGATLVSWTSAGVPISPPRARRSSKYNLNYRPATSVFA
jgi:hypothetical protein